MIRMRLRSPLRVPVLPFLIFVSLAFGGSAPALFAAGLEYLDAADPFHPGASTAKLTTPQWIGEPGVEAAVVLAIDDLRDTARYEQYLRPILNRLKRIDGRAPVSIMINAVDPNNPQLQRWLQEGLSLEVHTLGHPCPCLARGDFEGAAATYHGCVDLLGHIPGNRPVAFRMPCCDSMNSPSPRFYAEIFNRVSPEGRFLTLDSSVMNLFTPADASLPRELVQESSGRERFRRYLPAETNATTPVSMKSFATTIENYPYPYVFGTLAWQFPATVPSDWEAQNVNGKNSPVTVADWKAALDLTVLKQGVFTFIFHPHGWIRPEQMIEFIDYAVSRYGPRVKFLTFREAQERIDRHLLAGQPLRAPGGGDNGVRVLDLNNDGFMDVVIGNAVSRRTRIWDPGAKRWREGEFPTDVGSVRFGRLDAKTTIALRLVAGTSPSAESWVWHNGQWQPDPSLRAGLELDGRPVIAFAAGRDRGLRLRDVDRDGTDEVIVGNESQRAVFRWQASRRAWEKAAYTLPEGTAIVDAEGHDAGLRFVDVNEDGFDDVLFSNPERTSLHLFIPKTNARLMFYQGWNDEVFAANRRELDLGIPPIVRAGSRRNNGVWFARSTMWVQNEDTAHLPDKVDRRTFAELLRADQPKPMTPEQALAAFRVRPGFTVELVAAEPLVRDPIAFDWSADGRLWVVEMGDYPEGIGPERKPAGTVRLLEDTNGDGRYDKGTVFLEGLRYPTGVFPWRRGVLVSAAPDIIYAEDTDGDGRADRRETLFTGFAEGNPQHLVNGFEYGLDNWIYGANGDSGGKVRPAGMPGATAIDLSGRDFRFRPDDRRLESETGQTQFGRRRDDWGRWFGNNNPTWLWHYFVPERYLRRNPHLILKSAKRMLADYPNGTRLFPASRTRQRFNDHHQFHHVTSACSPTPYRDDLFGADFADSVFISDPVHNLIHREVLVRDGASFLSRRAEDEMDREFLASADNWFRPTTLKTGPDGALYIADMYRLVLEHPEWIPDPIEPRLDLRAGADMGRIYRVFPTGAALRRPPRLDRMNAAELAAALDSGNGWQRDTAQRLLVDRRDLSVVPALSNLVASNPRPKTRLHALWTLEGLEAVSPVLLRQALVDPHPAVRAAAVQLSEPFLRHNAAPALADALLRAVDDESPAVRFQVALSLGEWDSPVAGAALARLALRDAGDDVLQTGVLTSAARHVDPMLQTLLVGPHTPPPPARLLDALLGVATAERNEPALVRTLQHLTTPAPGQNARAIWQQESLAAFLDALDRRGLALERFRAEAGTSLRRVLDALSAVFAEARRTVESPDLSGNPAAAVAATRLLARTEADREPDLRRLAGLLQPSIPPEVQSAAIAALKRVNHAAAADPLLAGWAGFSPGLREEALSLLMSRQMWVARLLDAVEGGTLGPADLPLTTRQALLAHSHPPTRERATRLLATGDARRARLLDDYRGLAELKGDPARGAELYRANCGICHRLRGEGQSVGPDLDAVVGKPLEALLAAILDPNQAVEWRYVAYQAETRSGHEVTGIITAETPSSVTLRTAAGREETLLRSDLVRFNSSKLSLMPEGFEQILPPPAMADLVAFLRQR